MHNQWKILEKEDYNQSFMNLDFLQNTAKPQLPALPKATLKHNIQPQYQEKNYANVNRQSILQQLSGMNSQMSSFALRNTRNSSLWAEFKRIYFQEMLRFTMNKATFFTLIFSFMFLGCIFFLMGFVTATGIYNQQQHKVFVEEKIQRAPSKEALLQARPAKIVDMGKNLESAIPEQLKKYKGIRMSSNSRQPSKYVEQQINRYHPNYR